MLFECRRTQWRDWWAQAMLILLQSTLMACDVVVAGPSEKWQVSQAQVAKAFKELAAGATDVPLPDCKWTLQNAPKTFYAPQKILNGSETLRLHASIHLPAAGYTRVKQATAALWIVTGIHYSKVIRTLKGCKQQFVAGARHWPNKKRDWVLLRRLGSKYPWTQANDLYPLTYELGSAPSCQEWGKRVDEQLRRGPPERNPDAPAWVLKAPNTHFGKGVRFLRWDFAKEQDVAQVCKQHRGWIVQQMVHSMTAFKGGSTFSFRVLALVVSASPLKVVWSKTRGSFQFFADAPANSTGVDSRFLTNNHARPTGYKFEDCTQLAAPAFHRWKAGSWEECIAPQLKIAIVAYMLSMLSVLRIRESNNFNNWGCDFLVDEDLRVHLLECNVFPTAANPLGFGVWQEVYPMVLHEALQRSGNGATPASDSLKDYEVLLDEAKGYAFTSPRIPPQCNSMAASSRQGSMA